MYTSAHIDIPYLYIDEHIYLLMNSELYITIFVLMMGDQTQGLI